MKKAEPQSEHKWLQQLVGDWTYELDGTEGPGKPSKKLAGTEHVRSLGDIWVVAEGKGQMPDGATMTSIMTIGYDPQKQRYVGTWVGSPMTALWVYDGALDASGHVLTLESEGPDMSIDGKTARYRDLIAIESRDVRTLTGFMLGDDGEWRRFMRAVYRRRA